MTFACRRILHANGYRGVPMGKGRVKLVWPGETKGWRRSWCCREDYRVVGGGRENGQSGS